MSATFEKMCGDVTHRISKIDEFGIRQQILNSTSDEECFATIFPFLGDYKMNQSSAETEKSKDTSDLFRNKGNAAFAKKKYHVALSFYTQAIALAPPDSLSLAYANRSAVLMTLGLFNECLSDIQRALDNNYPDNLQHKVLMRQGLCYNHLHMLENATVSFSAAENLISKSTSLTGPQKIELMMKVEQYMNQRNLPYAATLCNTTNSSPPNLSYGVNKEIPAASNSVSLQYCTDRGRHLVTTRDVKPGDVLIVEQPFSAVLLPALRFSHCSNCLIRCHILQSCPNCSWAMFCSETCWKEAYQKFHKIECSAMRCIEKLNVKTFIPVHLAVRTLCQIGIDKCLDYHLRFTSNPGVSNNREAMRTRGFNSTGQLISSDFTAVYHQFGEAKYLYNFIIGRIVLSACILKALKLDKNSNVVQMGGLLLKLMRCHAMNAHEMYERYTSPESNKVQDVNIANGLYPTIGLINHSCDQNVIRHYHGKTVVLRAIKFISKGQEILDTYGPHFLCDNSTNRREHLRNYYFFDCYCVPCSENWPNQAQLPWTYPSNGKNKIQITEAYKKICNVLTEYVNERKVYMKNVPNLLRYLELLDTCDNRLCQEYYLIQEIIKVSFATLGNSYICRDVG